MGLSECKMLAFLLKLRSDPLYMRIVNQSKRIEELRAECIKYRLKEAKRVKETTEQELGGYEVELSMNEASLQALEDLTVNISTLLVVCINIMAIDSIQIFQWD